MLSEVKVFHFYKGVESAGRGYTRIDGGSPVHPVSFEEWDAKVKHASHADMVRKLRALIPAAHLVEIWQTADDTHFNHDFPANYHRMSEARTLLVLFMHHGAPPNGG